MADDVIKDNNRTSPWPDWAKPNMPESRLLDEGRAGGYLHGKESLSGLPLEGDAVTHVDIAIGRSAIDCSPTAMFIYRSMSSTAQVDEEGGASKLDGTSMAPKMPLEMAPMLNMEDLKQRQDELTAAGKPHGLTDAAIGELRHLENDKAGKAACEARKNEQLKLLRPMS